MDHQVISPNYAMLLKLKGIHPISEFSYLCRFEYDENEFILQKTEDIEPPEDGDHIQLPALHINELVDILNEANANVSILANNLEGNIRIIMKGAFELDEKVDRAGRSNMDIQAHCIMRLIEEKIISSNAINNILLKNNIYKVNMDKLIAAIDKIHEAIDALRYALCDTK